MGNQLIREQVFDVLFNYVKRADGIYTESDCATVRDEICLQIDQSQFTADKAVAKFASEYAVFNFPDEITKENVRC